MEYLPECLHSYILESGRFKIDLPASVKIISTRTQILEEHIDTVRQGIGISLLKTILELSSDRPHGSISFLLEQKIPFFQDMINGKKYPFIHPFLLEIKKCNDPKLWENIFDFLQQNNFINELDKIVPSQRKLKSQT